MGLAARLLEGIFPSLCPGCDRRCERPAFCEQCVTRIAGAGHPRCPQCGRQFRSGGNHPCGACSDRPPPFERLLTCAGYSRVEAEAPVNRAIRRFKYDRDVTLARPLSELLSAAFSNEFDYDAIVPVPLHLSRLRWRGFNQAVLIAAPLARRYRRPLVRSALRRVRDTIPQVGLAEEDRHGNVAGAFRLRPGWQARGMKLLLVDDVYTTGATVRECARILRRAGARQIDVGVVARAE